MNQPMPIQPQAVPQASGAAIFGMENDEERIAYLKALGAKNVDPPCPKSTHLKVIANGRVLPWDELLAEQTDLVVCCDRHGNTDPFTWETQVEEYDPTEKQELHLKSVSVVVAQATQMSATHRVPEAVDATTPRPTEYPDGIVSIADVDKLLGMLE